MRPAGAPRCLFLIVDNLRVQHAKIVREQAEPLSGKIELFYLPPYAPESSPDESLNHDSKTSLRLKPASQNDDLMQNMGRFAGADSTRKRKATGFVGWR